MGRRVVPTPAMDLVRVRDYFERCNKRKTNKGRRSSAQVRQKKAGTVGFEVENFGNFLLTDETIDAK